MKNEIQVVGLDDIEVQNTTIEDIGSEEVTLVLVCIDQSGSMHKFISDMVKCQAEFRDALLASKEENKILLAKALFNNVITVGGYKKVSEFDITYYADNGTALYDVIIQGTDELLKYKDYLVKQGMRVKAVCAVFSDGEDTASAHRISDAKTSIEELNTEEITTAFISFGGADDIAKKLGFKNILKVGSSTSELRKAFNVLSKSVVTASKSVVADPNQFFVV